MAQHWIYSEPIGYSNEAPKAKGCKGQDEALTISRQAVQRLPVHMPFDVILPTKGQDPVLTITVQAQAFRPASSSRVVGQPLSRVRLFATPWTAARQASLSFTISWSLLKLISIESVMSSNPLVLCRPFFLLSSIFPSIRVFSNGLALHIRGQTPKARKVESHSLQTESTNTRGTPLCDQMSSGPWIRRRVPGISPAKGHFSKAKKCTYTIR